MKATVTMNDDRTRATVLFQAEHLDYLGNLTSYLNLGKVVKAVEKALEGTDHAIDAQPGLVGWEWSFTGADRVGGRGGLIVSVPLYWKPHKE